MLSEEYSLSPSSSSSSSSSLSSSSPSTSKPPGRPSPKRKAGRKKFRETRHPVYHGVRARSGGRWVSEVREPRQKGRIWLGTFPTPEMAARAHDVAAIALRGASAAQLNFADSATALPRATSAAPHDVRRAAAEAAEMYRSSKCSSPPPPPPQPPDAAVRRDEETRAAVAPVAPVVFVDEEAVFNMPELMEDMARGMMVTPPAMQRGFDWHNVDGGEECVVDLTLWSD